MNTLCGLFLLSAVAAVPAADGTAPAVANAGRAHLHLTIAGITAAEGFLMIALYDDDAAFDGNGAPAATQRVAVTDTPRQRVTFTDLAPGAHAVRLFHDVNGNGTLDTNPFGLPVEPIGFSGDARGEFGSPEFAAAAFTVEPGRTLHTITLFEAGGR